MGGEPRAASGYKYPTDLYLLNEVRQKSEKIIDRPHEQLGSGLKSSLSLLATACQLLSPFVEGHHISHPFSDAFRVTLALHYTNTNLVH